MKPSFNLIDEPWIPCIDRKGNRCEKNLRDVFAEAHELESIHHDSPLVTASLFRFLLAILHRNFGPDGIDEWLDLWKNGYFDACKLDKYLNKWHHRFDLFDEKYPFYQYDFIEGELPKNATSINKLIIGRMAGNNDTLFHHSFDDNPVSVDPKDAAQHLITMQNYAIGGGVSAPFYFSNSTLSGLSVVFLEGKSLFHSLLLNMLYGYDRIPQFASGKSDIPAWEKDDFGELSQHDDYPRGYLDYLTLQNRRIRLNPEVEEDGAISIRNFFMLQGRNLENMYDPQCKYGVSKKNDSIYSVKLKRNRAFWRDSEAFLLLDADSKMTINLLALEQLKNLAEEDLVFEDLVFQLKVNALITDAMKAAKIHEWRRESLPLPTKIISNQDLVIDGVMPAMKYSEKIGNLVNFATEKLSALILYPEEADKKTFRPGREQKKDITNLKEALSKERDFWAKLGLQYSKFIVGLTDDLDKALSGWKDDVRQISSDVFEATCDGLEFSANNLKAISISRRFFYARLKKLSTADEAVEDEK